MRRTLDGFKGLSDNVLARLRENLYRHIVGYHIFLNQCPDEIVLRIRGGREAYLDLLEADLYQQLEEFEFILQTHRVDQSLIAVSQIHAAPDGRFLDAVLFHPVVCNLGGHMVGLDVFFLNRFAVHVKTSFLVESLQGGSPQVTSLRVTLPQNALTTAGTLSLPSARSGT